jgi:hypothetical protein
MFNIPRDRLSGVYEEHPPDKLTSHTRSTSATISNEINDLQSIPPVTLLADVSTRPPDSLNLVERGKESGEPPDILTGGSPDKMSVATADDLGMSDALLPDMLVAASSGQLVLTPPDKLTGPLYQTLSGTLVDALCIHTYDNAQNAHTASEHMVYTTMWKMLGTADDQNPTREGLLPIKAIAKKVSISVRNLRRILRSLEEKLAIEVTEYEDKQHSIPRRYRVWGFRPVMDRRRAAGYHFIYRNRNLITLARSQRTPPDNLPPAPTDNLSGPAPVKLPPSPTVNLTAGPPDKLSGAPPDNLTPRPPDKLSASLISTSNKQKRITSSTAIAMVATVLREELGVIDNPAAARIVTSCRHVAPDATDDEIADICRAQAQRYKLNRSIDNPVGMLIRQMPNSFQGEAFAGYRRAKHQAQHAEEHRREAEAAEWRKILNDPKEGEELKQIAREALGMEKK